MIVHRSRRIRYNLTMAYMFYAAMLLACMAPPSEAFLRTDASVLRVSESPWIDITSLSGKTVINTGAVDIQPYLDNAVQQINAAGHGTLYFPPGTYKIWNDNSVGSATFFHNVDGVTILAHGAKFVQGFTMLTNESRTLFGFDGYARNITIPNIEFEGSVTQVQVALGTYTGTSVVLFQNNTGGGYNINIGNIRASGAGSALQMTRTYNAPAADIIYNVHVGNVSIDNASYGITLNNTAWNFTVDHLKTYYVYRSFFIWGIRGVKAHIESKDAQGNDCYLNSDGGMGVQDADITYINKESTNIGNASANRILIQFNNNNAVGTPAVFRNIHIKTDQQFSGAGSGWMALSFFKSNTDTGEHHVLENFQIEGYIKGTPETVAYGVIGFDTDYTWDNGALTNMTFGPLTLDNSTFINIISNPITAGLYIDVQAINGNGQVRVVDINESLSTVKYEVSERTNVPNAYAYTTYGAVPTPGLKVWRPVVGNPTLTTGLSEKIITNDAASGGIAYTLPAAAVGLWYTFVRSAAFEIRVIPDGAETIKTCGAGKYFSLDNNVGQSATLRCFTAGQWELIASSDNTWTCEP